MAESSSSEFNRRYRELIEHIDQQVSSKEQCKTNISAFNKELKKLRKYEVELVSALERVNLKKLSDELCKTDTITEQTSSDFRNLDLRVDQNLKARRLFQLVCNKISQNNELFHGFLMTISKWDQLGHVCECLRREMSATVPKQVQTLTEDDIPGLMNDLANAAHKWQEIGIAVKIPTAKLIDIANENMPSTIKLHRVLTIWIIEGTSLKEVTPNTIKKVLSSPLVRLPSIAEQICSEDIFTVSNIDNSSQCLSSTIIYQSIKTAVSYKMSTLIEVQVISDKPVFYQWYKDGQLLLDDKSYRGTSSNILLISHRNMASRHIEGRYVCEVEGIGRSREILVTIEYPESIQHLLDRYSSLREVPEDSWPPENIRSFVELALIGKSESNNLKEYNYTLRGDIDDILCAKQRIYYELCFRKYESRTLLVVEGRPGVGKTTLAHKVTRDWSTGENVLVGADLVFLVSLRLLNMSKTNSMFELLGFNNDKLDKDLIKDFELKKGLKCCFILDGLDEYWSYNYEEINVVYDLIKKSFSKAMVIVFSQPVGNKKLTKCRAVVDRRIEILGFKSDQINHYINTYFQQDSEKAKKLLKYLKEHSNVLHMCYLPVHVAMICYIHSQYEDSDILNTETQIYERFAMLTIIRKLRRECSWEVSNQLTCFQSLNDRDMKLFMNICKLAFDMCVQQKQVFENLNNDIILSDEFDSDEHSLGLVIVDSTAKLYNYRDIYTFLHLTFQEYLAAYHIFNQTSDQQLSIIDMHEDNDAMLVVWKFYCGMMGQKTTFCRQIQTIFSSKHTDTLYRVHCAFESQQPAVCDAVIEHKDSLSFKNKIFTLGDYNAISYVMSEASIPTTKLAFYSCRLDQNGVKQLIETARNNKLRQVKTFVFHFPNPTLDQFQCVNWLLCSMKSLEILDLYKTALYQYSMTEVARNVTLPHLKCIKITVYVPDEVIKNYFQHLTLNSKPEIVHYRIKGAHESIGNLYDKSLKYVFGSSIFVRYDDLLNEYVTNLSNLKLERNLNLNVFSHCSIFYLVNCSINDQKINSLSESLNSISVKELILDFNMINHGAATLVSSCTKLKHLSVRCNSIDDEGVKSLVAAVHDCTDLVHLDLEYNCFGDEGAIALASAVSHLNIQLNLYNANLTEKGFTSVSSYVGSVNIRSPQICNFKEVNALDPDCFNRAIKCCTSITRIKLYGYDLSLESVNFLRILRNLEELHVKCGYRATTTDHLLALFDQFKFFSNLRTLHIGGNNIGSEVAAALADGLKSCTNLQTLDISGNDIGSGGTVALAESLKSFTNLQTLDISLNSISSDGAAALADGLKFCINLQTLFLMGNNIGSEGASALADGLKFCTNLKTLNFSWNKLRSEGASALADGLMSCTNLQTLNFSWNKLGSEGAAALANGLKFCTNLQTLDISSNNIGSKGAAALADSLKSCTNLQTLDIRSNRIGLKDEAALARSLRSYMNVTIRK